MQKLREWFLIETMFERHKIQKILEQFSKLDEKAQREGLEKLAVYGNTAIPYIFDALRRRQVLLTDGRKILSRLYSKDNLDAYIKMLKEPRDDIRGMVKDVIQKIAGAAAIPALMENFGHADFQIRKAVCDLLSAMANDKIIPRISPYLQSKQKDIQKSAIELLGRIGGVQAIPLLTPFFKEEDWWIRRKAVDALCNINDSRALPPLADLLAGEKEPLIIKSILEAFAVIGDKSIVPSVLPFLKHADLVIRQKAVDALGKTAAADHIPDLMKLMRESDVNVRRGAVEVLNMIKDPQAGKVLIKCVKDSDWWVREIATDALAEISGGNINQMLVRLLSDPDENVRRSAVEYFNRVAYPPAYESLLRLLDDRDWWVREKAITALGKLNKPEAIPHIMRLVNDAEIKWAIPHALGEIKSEKALPYLLALLKDADKAVRISTLKAIQNLDHPDVIPGIKETALDHDLEVADTALAILKNKTGRTFARSRGTERRAPTPGASRGAAGMAPASVILSPPQTSGAGALKEAIVALDQRGPEGLEGKTEDPFAARRGQTLTDFMKPLASVYKARFMNSADSGFLGVFSSARDAVLFSLEMLKAVREHNQKVERMERMHLRLAIHAGVVRSGAGDKRSERDAALASILKGVSREMLIECRGGMKDYEMPETNRLFITEAVYNQIKDIGDFRVSLVGMFELDGTAEKTRVYSVSAQAEVSVQASDPWTEFV
ncbi:MAG: HEAT repeat domain-containing protein [Nitrospinae bacterium]|nr:HEAT repeat domain-containing protein [Nitrospinota bacterium]